MSLVPSPVSLMLFTINNENSDSYLITIKAIHENTQQVFKLKENVENFVAGVSEYGVPRHKLFAVNDLFEGASIFKNDWLFFIILSFSFIFHPTKTCLK